jgi:hypothetical protein
MSTIEHSWAAGASAAPEAAGGRLTASPNPHHERRWMALGVGVIAQIMILLDATVVNVALPSARRPTLASATPAAAAPPAKTQTTTDK